MDSSHGYTMEMYLISVNCTLRNGKDGIFVQLKKKLSLWATSFTWMLTSLYLFQNIYTLSEGILQLIS